MVQEDVLKEGIRFTCPLITKVKEAEQEAEALRVKAQGEADANTILNASLTDKVIQHDAVEKWNGEPVKVAGNGVNTVLDIAGLAD